MRIAVLAKRTSYRTFVAEGGDSRVSKLLDAGDPTVRRMRRSHDDHMETEREVRAAIDALGLDAEYYEGSRTPIKGHFDLVITVGGDGTVLGASHQIGSEGALLGVNSAPGSSVGFFCAATKGNVRPTLEAAIEGKLLGLTLTRMRVEVNDRLLHNRVLNEALFCHASPAATSRYILTVTRRAKAPSKTEEQKSSGLWIGPAAGSTAAQQSAGGEVLSLASTEIQYVVREAYRGGGGRPPALVRGRIEESGRLELACKMRQAKLFLDGNQGEHDLGMGDRIVMRRSDETLTILGLTPNGQKKPRPRT
jgi:NAD+ kinase